MKRRLLTSLFLLGIAAGSTTNAQELTVASAPPVVVKTIPEAGLTDVDPGLSEIRITFSKDMQDGNFSIVQASDETFPKMNGKPKFDKDGRTCTLSVKLEAGKDYYLWMNTPRFQNFKDRDRRPAVPYLLVFKTKGEGRKTAAIAPETFGRAYDALCDDMGLHYSYFDQKGVDWNRLKVEFRPRAAAVQTEHEFVGVIRELLTRLRDAHVWIDTQGTRIPTYVAPGSPANFNRKATLATLEQVSRCDDFAVVGKTRGDGFGAIVLTNQSAADSESVRKVAAFVESMSDALGFLVDLRTANGGNELLAQQVASLFCERETVYARSQYRSGPEPSDYGPPVDRILPASEHPYRRPVVCLIGPGCVSSGEGFAKMMKSQSQVTLVGARTRGSSGNPRPLELPGLNVTVWYSRWVDQLPDGTPIEGKGVAPDVEVAAPADSHADIDPTWTKAIEILRQKVAMSGR